MRIWREDEKGNVFRMVKQMVRRNRDVVGASCVKGSDGKIVVDEDKQMDVCRAASVVSPAPKKWGGPNHVSLMVSSKSYNIHTWGTPPPYM